MINYKKLTAAMAAGIIAIFTITGCAMPWQKAADDSSSNVSTVSAGNLSQSGENALSLEFDSQRRLRWWSEWRFRGRPAWRTAWRQCT